MKKVICLVLALVMVVGLFGCAEAGKSKKHKKTNSGSNEKKIVNIEELKENEGPMLVVECYIPEWGETLTYTVDYSGTAYLPYNNGIIMSDEDLLYVYEFCRYAAANDPYADYSEDVCDGCKRTFTYYDTDGRAHELYSGYCYDNDELMGVMSVIGKYQLDDCVYEEDCDYDIQCK